MSVLFSAILIAHPASAVQNRTRENSYPLNSISAANKTEFFLAKNPTELKVRFSKVADQERGNQLTGAKLALYKGDFPGQVPSGLDPVKLWPSGKYTDLTLEDGTYTLAELSAPWGYSKAANIVLKVNNGLLYTKDATGNWNQNTAFSPTDPKPLNAYTDFTDGNFSWGTTPYGKNFYVNRVNGNGSTEGDEVIYCFNISLKAPTDSEDYGENIAPDISRFAPPPTFTAKYDASTLRSYASNPRIKDPEKFGATIQRIIHAGFPRNGANIKGDLTDTQFRTVTQLAIYNFSDSFGLDELAHSPEKHGFEGILDPGNIRIKKAYEKLVDYANSDAVIPADLYTPLYTPNYNDYQNFIGTLVKPPSLVPLIEMIDTESLKSVEVSFSKVEVNSTAELPGASLKVVSGESVNGSVVKDGQWVSTDQVHKITLGVGTYTMIESQAPKGYDKAENITFRVTDKGTIEIKDGDQWKTRQDALVRMEDAKTPVTVEVSFSKVEVNSTAELPGASLKVVSGESVNGSVVKDGQWVSTDQVHKITLGVGTYTMIESQAPKGYDKAENITFRVTDKGTIEIKDGDQWKTRQDALVRMEDAKTPVTVEVSFSKVEVNSTAELPGASLKVVSGESVNGSVVKDGQWVSTDQVHKITLGVGTYTMIESQAPKGYDKAENITFRVTDKGTIEIKDGDQWKTRQDALVRMEDAKTPVTVEVSFSKVEVNSTAELPGASLKVVSGESVNGSVVKDGQWVSTDQVHKITLGVGTYTMIESQAPKGYDKAENITFRVTDKGTIEIKDGDQWKTRQDALVRMEDAKTPVTVEVSFSKVEVNSTAELPGASLKVVSGESVNGSVVKDGQWVSTDQVHKITLGVGTYTMIESQAPKGYDKAENITFRVTDKGTIEIKDGDQWKTRQDALVRMEDAKTPVTVEVSFSKVEVNSTAELPGASLKVVSGESVNGSVVKDGQWVSTDQVHKITLGVGTYTMIESQAPKGYDKAENITFRVTDKGTIEIKDGDQWKTRQDALVRMEDAKTPVTVEVSFSKVEVNSTAELPGASLKVVSGESVNGSVVKDGQWVSTDQVHKITLGVGTYTMIESQAPKGYDKAENITFRVTDKGTIEIKDGDQWKTRQDALVRMEDAKTPVTVPFKPELSANKTESKKLAHTGASTGLLVALLTMLLFGGAATFATSRRYGS
ncbi:SpaA isopeptide-forming pilin-related protein [Arcanobacterium phocae]|uniref:SpaA isopeptide-forming pilin-related protein n=1 Tax=Arcanobacterium phocae TaxID=131112 RepID=UPI0012FB6C5C|nr:SpaA isopeptide-forming pilin-related protein [Arcanobacterium phocae]